MLSIPQGKSVSSIISIISFTPWKPSCQRSSCKLLNEFDRFDACHCHIKAYLIVKTLLCQAKFSGTCFLCSEQSNLVLYQDLTERACGGEMLSRDSNESLLIYTSWRLALRLSYLHLEWHGETFMRRCATSQYHAACSCCIAWRSVGHASLRAMMASSSPNQVLASPFKLWRNAASALPCRHCRFPCGWPHFEA